MIRRKDKSSHFLHRFFRITKISFFSWSIKWKADNRRHEGEQRTEAGQETEGDQRGTMRSMVNKRPKSSEGEQVNRFFCFHFFGLNFPFLSIFVRNQRQQLVQRLSPNKSNRWAAKSGSSESNATRCHPAATRGPASTEERWSKRTTRS